MQQVKTGRKVLILGAHQSYVRANAGGYVRLREFIKYLPRDISCEVIDISPSIYADLLPDEKIIKINLPHYIKLLISNVFIIGVLLERLYIGIHIYRIGGKLINSEHIHLIYVPIGELLHLYLPALLLKRHFPHIKVVVDILNFEYIQDSFIQLVRRFIIYKHRIPTAICLALTHYISFRITKYTINDIDHIFTVSPLLISEIKKIYFKKTIDFTPSGVNIPSYSSITKFKKKIYLCAYVGRVTEQKGIFNILDVWHRLISIKPEAKLVIAGIIDKETHSLVIKKIKEANLEKNIDLMGEVSEERKREILMSSEIFLHLANNEPLFPVIGILEGLSFGLPCITFNIPAIASQKDSDKKLGIFISPNYDCSAVMRQIVEIHCLSKKEKACLSSKSKSFAQDFCWENIAKKEFSVLSKLLYT